MIGLCVDITVDRVDSYMLKYKCKHFLGQSDSEVCPYSVHSELTQVVLVVWVTSVWCGGRYAESSRAVLFLADKNVL